MTRARIVDAAERMLVEQGIRATTTRALALEAGCAEGTLYVHFPDRVAIFAAVFEKRWPVAAEALDDLMGQVGRGSVVDNLTTTLTRVGAFLASMEPLVAAIKSDAAVGQALQARWREIEAGPQRVVQQLAAYIAAEQEVGRAGSEVDPQTAGETLIGFLFYTAASAKFCAAGARPLTEDRLRQVVSANVRPIHVPS